VQPKLDGNIFFACYGGGHSAALIPVFAQIKAQTHSANALALTTAKAAFNRALLPAIGMDDLVELVPEYRRAKKVGALLSKSQIANPNVTEAETLAYLGVGFHSLAKEHGLVEARAKYNEAGRQIFRPVDFFLRLFQKHRPSVVVATSAPRSERAVFEAARMLGIPSVCVVDLYAPFEIQWCATQEYASRYCVLNNTVRRRFIDAGVPPDRISPTGNPSFDRLAHVDKIQMRKVARAKLDLHENDRLIAWISQPEALKHPFSSDRGDPTYPQQVERSLASYFRAHEKVHLVMRLHPSEDRLPAATGPRIRYSDSKEPLDELLCAADCIITASSTVGLEAALLDVPVVQCGDSIFSADLPLASMGLATSASTYHEAGARALEVIERRTQRISVDYQCDGKAASRIAQQILELTS